LWKNVSLSLVCSCVPFVQNMKKDAATDLTIPLVNATHAVDSLAQSIRRCNSVPARARLVYV
jgi:hypothetical protein